MWKTIDEGIRETSSCKRIWKSIHETWIGAVVRVKAREKEWQSRRKKPMIHKAVEIIERKQTRRMSEKIILPSSSYRNWIQKQRQKYRKIPYIKGRQPFKVHNTEKRNNRNKYTQKRYCSWISFSFSFSSVYWRLWASIKSNRSRNIYINIRKIQAPTQNQNIISNSIEHNLKKINKIYKYSLSLSVCSPFVRMAKSLLCVCCSFGRYSCII